jgi:hypothetical protein
MIAPPLLEVVAQQPFGVALQDRLARLRRRGG